MLKIFATFLKKGSAKNFQTGKISNNIVRSTDEPQMFALHLIAFPLRGRCQPEGAKRVMRLTDEVEKIKILLFSIHNAFGYTSPPASQEPLLKEKPFKCCANKNVQFIMFFQLLIHRFAVPLLSQEKANLCHSFGS